MLLPAGGGGGGMSIIVPGAGSGAGSGGAGGGSPPGPPAARGGGFCGDGLMCEWVLLAAAVGLGLCTCCMLICAGAGCISAWTAPVTGGSSATPAAATGDALPKKIVASFLHGDTYSPGVLSARACKEQERGDPYSGINSLRSSGALAHQDGHPVTGPLRTSTSLAPLHGDDSGSIKARFDPGMGR